MIVMVKYSVLMSVYKKEKPEYLIKSIDSMINQTVKPEEIVLVEDGVLTNDLYEVINKYRQNYPNLFKIISIEKNVGLGVALNKGLKACSNELVARMDTDDISLPTRCEKQLKTFQKHPELSILGSNIDEFSKDPTKIVSSRIVPSSHEDIIKFSKRRSPFNHPTVMYKKSHVLKSGGYKNYRRNQDYELFVRMLSQGYFAMNINESLLLFRANEDNIKRRKSWRKTKGDIAIRYDFLKQNHISCKDFLITSSGFLISFLAPSWVFKFLSENFLRKKR